MEQTSSPKKKKSPFKKFLTALAIVVGLILLSAFVIATFFQDAVGNRLVSQLNKQLKTELKVGGFDMSLLKNFPNATVTLQDVVLPDAFKKRLLEAQEMSFHFGLLSLFGSKIKVHSITIRDGALNIHTNSKGLANYDIFKPSKRTEPSQFNISLEKATLLNMELLYRDERLKQEMSAQMEEAVFSGEFSSSNYALTSTAKLTSNFVDLDGVRYLPGKKLGYEATIQVEVPKGLYDFKNVKVSLEDNVFNLDGKIVSIKNYQDFDLKVAAEDASLESVVALLPAEFLSALGDFSSTGKFKFGASVKGRLSASESPAIGLEVSLQDGKVSSPRLKEPFKDVSFRMNFTNGTEHNNRTTVFEISNFKGYLDRQLITMSLKMDNMDNPYVDFLADGAIPLGYVYGLFNNPGITEGSGEVEFKNLKVNGLYNDMMSVSRITAVTMSGDITFDDASLKMNGEDMIIDRGNLHFDNNLVSLDELKIDGAGSEINLKGSAKNLLPVLLADSLNPQNIALEFVAELTSPKMDVGRLVRLTDVPVKEGEVKEEIFDSLKVDKNEQKQRFTDFLKGSFNARVDEFKYNKIEGEKFSGSLSFENSQMRVLGKVQGMEGAFDVDGVMFFEKEPRLEAKVSGERIDVKEFFRQTENVGQTYLTADNLEGVMNTKMLIHAFWDSTGVFLMNKLHVWAGVGMLNGQLKNFKMLDDFSTYVKISDLRDIRFVNMENWLEVKNGTFYLPILFIQNNAMNMTVAGEQTFTDTIDYSIKVNAGQVLASKIKKNNSSLDPIPAKSHGFFNLYFNIAGTVEKYKYQTNKKKVKDKFAKSERQKREVRAALVRAFGPIDMLKEPDKWQDEGETAQGEGDEYIEGF